jgi:hypothetical protein
MAVMLFTSVVSAHESAPNSPGAQSLTSPPAALEAGDGSASNNATEHSAHDATKKSPDQRHRPPILVEKKTSFIISPLRADGFPDYFAALNDHCRGASNSENNAANLLIQAFGPETVPAGLRDEYFKLLGIKALPAVGKYFVRSQAMAERWIKGAAEMREDEENSLQEQFATATEQPWSAAEYPMVAEWLLINDEPLRLIVDASHRPYFYEPILSPSPDLPALYSVVLPLEEPLGEIALALEARAMLRADSGDVESAWSDLLACQRCLRLMAGMPVGQYAVETRTAEIALSQTEVKLLHYCRPDANQIERMRSDLAALPPLPGLANRIDLGDRFRFLDAVCALDRQGPAVLQKLFGETSLTTEEGPLQKAVSDALFDWNEPLRMGNEWFDREVAVYRMTDHKKRDEALEQLHFDIEQMTADTANAGVFAFTWFAKKAGKPAVGKVVGASLLQLFDNEVPGILNVADQLELRLAFSQAGMALAAYRAEHGEYPERLDDLVPKYLAGPPRDLYGDQAALHYRRESSGYLLYSVGPNGRDEQGGTSDNFLDSDDISLFISDAPAKADSK